MKTVCIFLGCLATAKGNSLNCGEGFWGPECKYLCGNCLSGTCQEETGFCVQTAEVIIKKILKFCNIQHHLMLKK